MGRLMGYFQSNPIDSEGQLKAAQTQGRKYTAAENAHAKAAGFPSADAMTVYLEQKKNRSNSTVSGTARAPSLHDLFAWHPANTIGMAADALKFANER